MRVSTLVLAVVAVAGCASAGASEDSSNDIVPSGAIQYDGQFRSVQQSDGRLGMSTVQRVNGSVRIIYREATGRSAVSLTLATSSRQSEVLVWAVVPGRCGSGGIPVLPATQFPPLELGNTGRADINVASLQLALPPRDYHVNVYRGGETLADVIACSNLMRSTDG